MACITDKSVFAYCAQLMYAEYAYKGSRSAVCTCDSPKSSEDADIYDQFDSGKHLEISLSTRANERQSRELSATIIAFS